MNNSSLPEYQCHKVVQAFQIGSIDLSADKCILVLVSVGCEHRVKLDRKYSDKFDPEVLGYYVKYKDGYESYSPREAFEDGYSPVKEDMEGTNAPLLTNETITLTISISGVSESEGLRPFVHEALSEYLEQLARGLKGKESHEDIVVNDRCRLDIVRESSTAKKVA